MGTKINPPPIPNRPPRNPTPHPIATKIKNSTNVISYRLRSRLRLRFLNLNLNLNLIYAMLYALSSMPYSYLNASMGFNNEAFLAG